MRISQMRAVTVMLKPKPKATLSMPPRSPLLGNRADMSVYPGRKSTKGSPRMTRRTFGGKVW